MGQSCCSHIFENTVEDLLDDMLSSTCLFNYSYFQLKVMFEGIEKELETKEKQDEHEADKEYIMLINKSILNDECKKVKEVSANILFSYPETFTLNFALKPNSSYASFEIGNSRPLALFLISMICYANDLDKSQLILDICFLLQIQLEVRFFEKFLKVYLMNTIVRLYDKGYMLCNQNINTYMLGYLIDSHFIENAEVIKRKVEEHIEEYVAILYNQSFNGICLDHFRVVKDSEAFNQEEYDCTRVPKQVLDLFLKDNPWLFCLKSLRNNFREFVKAREFQLELKRAQAPCISE